MGNVCFKNRKPDTEQEKIKPVGEVAAKEAHKTDNWINQISNKAYNNSLSSNVKSVTDILPGMEGKNDIIGGILFTMWPSMAKMVENEVLAEVEKAINISLKYVPGVNSFRFTKCDMGSVCPRMRNFRLLDNSNNSVIMQLDIDYDGDCIVNMEVGTSVANIPLGIQDIKLSGTMRIELKDMVPCSPLISAVVAYFINPPEMNFDLTGTANIADHPWISSTVRKLVLDGLGSQLVDPNRIVVPLAAKCASKYRWPQPKNVWKITVVEAENLVNADGGMLSFLSGKSDPYVKVFMNNDNQGVTPILNDNLNPKWNHSMIMRTYRDDVSVQFNIYDSDMTVGGVTVDSDDELGVCRLNLGELDGDSFDGWLDLKNIKHGRLHVKAEKFYPSADPVSMQEKQEKSSKSDPEEVQMVQLWVRDLENIDATAPGYKTKKDVYKVKAIFSDGTEFDFGAGAYEPALEQTTALWDQAKHHFGDVSMLEGKVSVIRIADGAETTVLEYPLDMLQPINEITKNSCPSPMNFHARVIISNFKKN